MTMADARNLSIAYIGGGSRGWAWGFMMDLASDPDICGTVRLYDIDRAAAEANRVIGEKVSAHPDAQSQWRYEVADTLEAALKGADFCVISILPGTFDEMRSDVHAPEALGVWQSVGDTVGPGGFVRGLRAIPMLREIGLAVRDHAPEAWVINYTNPMSLCIAALYDAHPGIRAFGCCHEVFGTQKLMAAMLRDMAGVEGVQRQDIRVNVQGINHFTWFDAASFRGTDLFPMFEAFCDKYHETGFSDGPDDNWMNSVFDCAHRVKFDLFRRYGLIAAAGDRHLAEFMPRYLASPEVAHGWMFGLTPVDWRTQDLQRRLRRSAALVSGKERILIAKSGEEGHLLMKALLGLSDLVSNVNLPNRGQIENLPLGSIVETNALFRHGEIRPVLAGPMKGDVQVLVMRHALNQKNTLRAAVDCDYQLALAAFMNDPMMANVSWSDGDVLLRRMMQATRRYLPKAWNL